MDKKSLVHSFISIHFIHKIEFVIEKVYFVIPLSASLQAPRTGVPARGLILSGLNCILIELIRVQSFRLNINIFHSPPGTMPRGF
jgi:hypothetical protein